jgi:two-component system, cell cycle response regulator
VRKILASKARDAMPSQQIQILLIEADPMDARRLAQMLRSGRAVKFRLRRAHKACQAKRHLQNGNADVALVDLTLPDAQGLDLLVEVQRTAPSVPFIALSGAADDSLAAQALQLGAQDFLVKSELNPARLVRALSFAIARQQAQLRLHSLSLLDELTGLHNRRGFISLAEQQLKLSSRQGVRSTLIFIDVDNLKYINDKFGHREGDYALQQIAGLLRECFRESDIIGRLGGDEFCALLSDPGQTGDVLVRQRLLQLLRKSNENSTRFYKLSVSLGIVDIAGPHELDQQISRADALMYEHKRTKQFRTERLTHLRELA